MKITFWKDWIDIEVEPTVELGADIESVYLSRFKNAQVVTLEYPKGDVFRLTIKSGKEEKDA